MKQIIVSLLVLLSLITRVNAQAKPIQIIYVHGAQQYTQKKKDSFIKAVHEIHKAIFRYGKKSEIVKNTLLLNGNVDVVDTPEYFYWGDQYEDSINKLEFQISSFKKYYDSIAGLYRKMVAYPLHDLLWLSKYHNKKKIVTGLFEKVKEQSSQGKDIILLGHSAGSVVVYNLMIYRAPIVNVYKKILEKENYDKEIAAFFKENPYTCIQALLDAKVVKINESGKIIEIFSDIQSKNFAKFEEEYYKETVPRVLDYTKTSCLEPESVISFTTFGSPLLASTSLDGDFESNLNAPLVKHIMKHGIAWLHLTHFKDPIGMPIKVDNAMQELIKSNNFKTDKARKGFVINNPKKVRGANVFTAHGWYFNNPNSFAKLIIKTYEEGIKRYYPELLID